MTGSALSIAAGQIGALMGYSSKFNTREATYKVIVSFYFLFFITSLCCEHVVSIEPSLQINSFRHLPDTTIDAAFGLSGLVFLYVVRSIFNRLEIRSRNPVVKKIAFFSNTLRTSFVIVFLTLFSWVYLRNKKVADYPISILKDVPVGSCPSCISCYLALTLPSTLPSVWIHAYGPAQYLRRLDRSPRSSHSRLDHHSLARGSLCCGVLIARSFADRLLRAAHRDREEVRRERREPSCGAY
jgi:MFS superfamily sulfate permease-like transporter